MRWIKRLYQWIVLFLRTRITRVQYIMLISVLVGLFSGLASVFLKSLVHSIQHTITNASFNFAYLIFPVFGLLLTVFLIRNFFSGHFEKGIAMVLRYIARFSSFIPLRHTYQHILTSSITVGLGGSVGLEAPIVATGSAIGSNTARISDLNYRERTLLIACGAAAGISAVFNAPIAGVMFAVEVLLTETIVSYFIPLIISSVVGALCSKVILQESSLFNFVLQEKFDYINVPFYILLGIFCGFVSLYYARVYSRIDQRLHNLKMNAYLKALWAGILLAILYLGFPPLFGEGYDKVKLLANGQPGVMDDYTRIFSLLQENWSLVIFAGIIVLLKPVAAAITIGGGGNGGNFAPSLFTGSFLGYFLSKMVNTSGWFRIPESNFTLVGMAGVLSGVMYCPLSAIFLIAEITNGYELFIPLMLVSSISFFIVKSYNPYSMETKKLAAEGQIFTHQKEKNILTRMQLEELLQDKGEVIPVENQMSDLVNLVKRSEKNIFAVEDEKKSFIGIIELNDIKKTLFDRDAESTPIKKLVKKPPEILYIDENMHRVMEKFDISRSWYLPVLTRDRKFIGFLSQSSIFNKYREILSSQSDLYDPVN